MDALDAKGEENFNAGDRRFYPLWQSALYMTDKTKGKPPRLNYNDLRIYYSDAKKIYSRSQAEIDLWYRMMFEWTGSGWR